MKIPIKIFKSRSLNAGFTLVELLVAASITTIVVAIAGSGVVTMLQINNKAESENLRRVELNRALDFMNEEVRMAKSIAVDASANLTTVAKDFKSSGTPILTLEIPGVSQRVLYYIKDASSPWSGPKVIYRWGPNFDGNGQYTDPTTPDKWKDSLLVDLIADPEPYSNTTCPTGWSANPSSTNGQGFYACVLPYANNELSGKIANIQLRGQLTYGFGNSKDTLAVSTDTFARASDPLSFTTSGGTLTITSPSPSNPTQPSNAYFEIMGGSMDCFGKEIPTTTTINVTPKGGSTTSTIVNPLSNPSNKTLNLSADPATKITVTGFAKNSACYGFPDRTFNSENDKDTQVWTLRDGDTPPPFAPYGKQPKIDAFLKNYLDANGKVKLAANQVIYLFELFTTDKTSDTYDMQDIIVLATITPK